MLHIPSLEPLIPKTHTLPNGSTVYLFPNDNLELVKLDFTVEGGSAHQSAMSQAHAANTLFGEATQLHTAEEMAEFMDFRGIVAERMIDTCTGNVSFYFLRRYADELLPLIREMFDRPLVPQSLFDAYRSQREQQIRANFQKTAYMARLAFYEQLYTFEHPLGAYAHPEDVAKLTLDHVSAFMQEHYRLEAAHIVLAGQIDDELLALVDRHLSPAITSEPHPRVVLSNPSKSLNRESINDCGSHSSQFTVHGSQSIHVAMPSAVQTSLRIGRVLPLAWSDPDYARFLVLNTILGGYFGSRLMSNIREDKGYTYGIYSMTQVFRGSVVFYITADVAADVTQAAVDEVFCEIRRLQDEPVPQEELELVRNYMMGDFIRSIDGTFELSERYRQMVATDVTEQLTRNLLDAIQHVTPERLQSLARTYLTDLLTVTAGQEGPEAVR